MTLRPLCFVLMPFGQKSDPSGGPRIDFDRIYREALAPGIEDAGMEPIRSDEERTGGIIHLPMFERLLLCDFALADLTTANANVFYELGVRHAARPSTTLTIFARHQAIPFDVNFLRSMPYDLGDGNAFGGEQAEALRMGVSERLQQLRDLARDTAAVDSPLFQLLSEWKPGVLARLKTDVFRDQVRANEALKQRLGTIREMAKAKDTRAKALGAMVDLRAELEPLDGVEVGTLVDVLLTYRALENWGGMIALYDDYPETLKRQVLVREQLGFAYNRRAGTTKDPADRAEALRILEEVEDQQGASSETCGLIGRIYKDYWQDALSAGDGLAARSHLRRAIETYRRGYMADQRDAYPGINLLTLLDVQGKPDSLEEKGRLLPVVRFAVEQRLAGAKADYWDHATMLELAALGDDAERAMDHLEQAVAELRETWEAETTANNLRLIAAARRERGLNQAWLSDIIGELDARAT